MVIGQELDPETGLYYYGGRYYDPEISRFVSPDPFVPSPDDPQSLNRYSYTINNPQRYTDPTGYVGEDAVAGISIISIVAWYEFFKSISSLFSSPHKPKPIRRLVNHPMNQPRERNWGGPLSDSMRVYVDNGYLQTALGFVEGDDQSNWDRLRLLRQAAEFFRDKVSRARKQIQRRLQTSIPSLCSYGGFITERPILIWLRRLE